MPLAGGKSHCQRNQKRRRGRVTRRQPVRVAARSSSTPCWTASRKRLGTPTETTCATRPCRTIHRNGRNGDAVGSREPEGATCGRIPHARGAGGADVTRLKHPFAPVWAPDARVLILGAYPSPGSVNGGGYYGFVNGGSANDFWGLMGDT